MSNVTTIVSKILSARRLNLLAVLLFMAVAAPFVSVSSASAAGCDDGDVCIYQHSNFGGTLVDYPISSPGCHNLGSLNNAASSVYNKTFYNIRYYGQASCNDSSDCFLQDGSFDYRLNLASDNFTNCSFTPNDLISSFRVYP